MHYYKKNHYILELLVYPIFYDCFITAVAVWPSQETFSSLNPSVPLSAVWSLNQQFKLDMNYSEQAQKTGIGARATLLSS